MNIVVLKIFMTLVRNVAYLQQTENSFSTKNY